MADSKLQRPKIRNRKSKIENRKFLQSATRNPQSAIIFVGFMASGKTTVAKALAKKSGGSFVDLDSFIESRERRKIAEIIDTEGIARFREIETVSLRDVLETKTHIIALGGGAWTIEDNRKLIAENNCLTVWLDTAFEICWERITREGDTRPLARDKEKAQKLFEERNIVYSLADLRIPTDEETNPETILALIGKHFVI